MGIYIVISLILAFVIYKTFTQSGNTSLQMYADNKTCAPGLVWNSKYHVCSDDPTKDVDFYDLCPPGKVPANGKCICYPLSANPDCHP